jgi:hypothetical protein
MTERYQHTLVRRFVNKKRIGGSVLLVRSVRTLPGSELGVSSHLVVLEMCVSDVLTNPKNSENRLRRLNLVKPPKPPIFSQTAD